jgi:putative inorganic carbon (HCO3(-)) transporter
LSIGLLATFFSVHLPTSLWGKYERYEGFLTLVNWALLFFLAIQVFDQPKRVRSLQVTMISAALLISLYGLMQYLGYDFITWGTEKFEATRSFSTLGNPVMLAGYLVLILPLAIFQFLEAKKRAQLIFYGVASLAIFFCLVTTFSRGGWVAGLFALLFLFLFLQHSKIFLKKFFVIVFILVVAVALVFIVDSWLVFRSKNRISLVKRVASIQIQKGSLNTRLLTWDVALKMLAKQPLIGSGPDTFHLTFPSLNTLKFASSLGRREQPDNAHNYFLQIGSTLGVIGLFSFLAISILFLFFIKRVVWDVKGELSMAGLAAGGLGYLIYLLSGINEADTGSLFWIFIALLVAQHTKTRSYDLLLLKRFSGQAILITVVLGMVAFWFPVKFFLADVHFLKAQRLMSDFPSFDRIVAHYNSAVSLNPYENFYLLNFGRLYEGVGLQTGNWLFLDKAMDYYLTAQRKNPLDIDAYMFLSNLYLQVAQRFDQKYFNFAERELRQALKIAPYWADAHYMLGIIFFLTDRFEEAKQAFQSVIKIDAADSYAYFYLGRSYEVLQEKEKARLTYESALKLKPNYEEARRALKRLE